jgi:hypothetical protein
MPHAKPSHTPRAPRSSSGPNANAIRVTASEASANGKRSANSDGPNSFMLPATAQTDSGGFENFTTPVGNAP